MHTSGTWEKGMASPNPKGRGSGTKYRYSARTPLGALERFRQNILTQKEAERLYRRLEPREQLAMWQMVYRQLDFGRLNDEELDLFIKHLEAAQSKKSNENKKT